jgi:Peptidase family M28
VALFRGGSVRQKTIVSIILSLAVLLPTLAYAQKKNEKTITVVTTNDKGLKSGLDAITAAQMRDILTVIAADELEGRDTPSRGLDMAAKFIAYNLSRWGFKPGGDNGSFMQRFNLRRGQIDAGQTKLDVGGQSFKFGDDFLPRPTLGTGKGQLVYVGHGLVVKAKGVNAYAGIDVKDKIVIAAEGSFPKGIQPGDLKGKAGVDYETASSYASSHGAKAVILVPSPTMVSRWDNMKRSLSSSRPSLDAPIEGTDLPTAYATEKLLKVLFEGEKIDGAAVMNEASTVTFSDSFALNSSKEVTLTVSGKIESLPTQNVVAIWEGSDPTLKNEYIAIGAHYDHVGLRPESDQGKTDGWSRYKAFLDIAGRNGGKDMLWNGADDDGSGTTGVLAIAEALTKAAKPKRSIVLVWHAGEEKGLWGSEYFADHPTVPINQIVTQLNIDMIGRSRMPDDKAERNAGLTGPNGIYVIGSKMMSTELGEISEGVNSGFLKLDFDYKYDAPNDPERLFYRSDHFNYARKGIPIIFYFDGIHVDYHGADDEVERIDFQKMEKVTRTVFATMWELANRPNRVKVDKPLPAQYAR